MAGSEGDSEVGNEIVGGLAGAVGNEDGPAEGEGFVGATRRGCQLERFCAFAARRRGEGGEGGLGFSFHLRFDSFRDTADLVDLQQEAVASILALGYLDALDVGGQQVITNQLDGAVLVEVGPSGPVILSKGVL